MYHGGVFSFMQVQKSPVGAQSTQRTGLCNVEHKNNRRNIGKHHSLTGSVYLVQAQLHVWTNIFINNLLLKVP